MASDRSDPGSGNSAAAQVARAKVSSTEKAARVDRIVDMMRRLDWVKGVSSTMLAQEWGLAVSTVECLSSEASRIIRREAQREESRGETQLSIGANLRHLSEILTARTEELLEKDPDGAAKLARSAVAAGDKATLILGERAPEKSEITVSAKELEALPPAALLARIRDQRARLDDAERKLLDEHPELAPSLDGVLEVRVGAAIVPFAPPLTCALPWSNVRTERDELAPKTIDVRTDPFCPPDATPEQIAYWNALANGEKP